MLILQLIAFGIVLISIVAYISFNYLSNEKPFRIKKGLTLYLFFSFGFPVQLAIENIIFSIVYYLFALPILIISWTISREKRGKRGFPLPYIPFVHEKRKSCTKTSPKNRPLSNEPTQDRDEVIRQLQKDNTDLRRSANTSSNELQELERLRKIRFGE